jgi:hypothetical protein
MSLKMSRSDKSSLWQFAWLAFGEASPAAVLWLGEYAFAKPRKWRFDWADEHLKIAVEVDGGQWVLGGGRHNRDADREKMNEAAARGWAVFRFSTQQLETDPKACVDVVIKCIERKLSEGK